jgi:hypothetical protein
MKTEKLKPNESVFPKENVLGSFEVFDATFISTGCFLETDA